MREGARNRQLMKERVEQVQICAHTGAIHATIIALISKRASNNVLPRIDLTKLYPRRGKVEYETEVCEAGAII